MTFLQKTDGSSFNHLFDSPTLTVIRDNLTKTGLEVEISLGCKNNWINTHDKRLRYNSYCKREYVENLRSVLQSMALEYTKTDYVVYISQSETKRSSYRKILKNSNETFQKKSVIHSNDDILYNTRLRVSLEEPLPVLDVSLFNNSQPLYKSRETYVWSSEDAQPFCKFDITKTKKSDWVLYQIEIEFFVDIFKRSDTFLFTELARLQTLLKDFLEPNKSWLFMSKKQALPNIQRPITLRREHIHLIVKDHACTRKFDGTRCFLVFDKNDTYIMNMRGKTRILDRGMINHHGRILLDCEYIHQNGKETCHIFDCIHDDVSQTHKKNLEDRIRFCTTICKELKSHTFSDLTILMKRIEISGKMIDMIRTLEDTPCNYDSDGLIFIPKLGSYDSTISTTYKYKPIDMITIDVSANLKHHPIIPYCKHNLEYKLIPLVTNLDLSSFTKKNIQKLVQNPNIDTNVTIECKVINDRIVPFRYRPDKKMPNKESVILDNLEVIQQMKQCMSISNSNNCLIQWITEYENMSKNDDMKMRQSLKAVLSGENVLVFYGYENLNELYDEELSHAYHWYVLDWKRKYHFSVPKNMSYVAYDAYPIEAELQDHILSIYNSNFPNDEFVSQHMTILETRTSVCLKDGGTIVLMFQNTSKENNNKLVSKLNQNQKFHSINEFSVNEWMIYVFQYIDSSNLVSRDVYDSDTDLPSIMNKFTNLKKNVFKDIVQKSKSESFFSTEPVAITV